MNKQKIVEILETYTSNTVYPGIRVNNIPAWQIKYIADEIQALQVVEDRGWYNNIEFNCPLCNKRIAVPVEKPPKEGADMTTEEKHEFALELVRTGQIGANTYNVIHSYLYP